MSKIIHFNFEVAIRWPRNQGKKLNESDRVKLNKPEKVSNFSYKGEYFQPRMTFILYWRIFLVCF